MRRLLASIISAAVVLFGISWLLLGGSAKVLDVAGRVMIARDLTDRYSALIDWIAAHPSITDILPWILVVAGLGSLSLIHVWPHAVHDLLGRKRIKCVFDPKIRGCLRSTQAALRLDELFPIEKEVTTYLPVSTAKAAVGKFTTPEECCLVRVQIQPKGDYEIENGSASLISIRAVGGRCIYDDGPLALTIMPAERPDPETKRLFPRSPEYVDVFRLTESNRVRIMSRLIPASIDLDKAFSVNGDYIFEVVVSGRECPSEVVKIGLHWEQDWRTATVWSFKDRIIGPPVACHPSPMPPTLREETLRITLP